MVANWLYGVAHQTALKARATGAKRKVRERQVTEMPEPAVAEHDHWRDLQPLLDEELSRLPDKYRIVVVLCDLEGKTRREAARQLGVPEGTVAGRLARAGGKLAKRLTQRGVVLTGAALAATLMQNVASAGAPTSVVSSTIQIVALSAAGQAAGVLTNKVSVLTEGVLKSMLLTKLKIATTVVLGAILACSGIGLLSKTLIAAGGTEPRQESSRKGKADDPRESVTNEPRQKNPKAREDPAKRDQKALQGTWTAVILERNGQKAPDDVLKDFKVVFQGDKMIINPNSDNRTSTFKLDPGKKPKWLDNTPEEGPAKGKSPPAIYELDGDTLKMCFDNEGRSDNRPSEFKTTEGSGLALFVLKRDKEANEKKEKK